MASCGHKVVLATYSVFATMRACEQLRTYICHPKQDVMVMGTHAGLQTGSEGVSHTAIEDIAILRALPNMTIIQPSDGCFCQQCRQERHWSSMARCMSGFLLTL